MKAYYALQWKKMSKSWIMYFSFVGSVLLMYFLSSIFTFGVALPGVIIMNTIIVSLMQFGSDLIDLKTSTIFKSIGGAGLSKSKLLISSFFFTTTFALLTSYWLLLWAAIFDRSNISTETIQIALIDDVLGKLDISGLGTSISEWIASNPEYGVDIDAIGKPFTTFIENFGFYPFVNEVPWTSFDWFTFHYCILISTILCTLLAILFVSISNNQRTYSVFAFSYLFIGIFVGGLITPLRMSEDSGFAEVVCHLFPHSYVVEFFTTSMGVNFSAPVISEGPILDANGDPIGTNEIILDVSPWDFSYTQNMVNFGVPLIICGVAGLIDVLVFRWAN